MNFMPLALNTLREAIRDKILYVILLFAFLLMAFGILLRSLSLNQEIKIVMDLGLSSINIFGLILTVFIGTNLLNKEIDKKTIFLLLSKPLNRSDFILGKFLGLSMTLFIITISMAVAFYAVLGYSVGGGEGLMPILKSSSQALILSYLEMLVLTAFAIFFSTFATPIMSAVFTMGIYVIGHMSNDILSFGQLSGQSSLRQFTEALFYLLPDLERLNLKSQLMTAPVPSEILMGSLGYGLLYSLALLFLAMVIFESREF